MKNDTIFKCFEMSVSFPDSSQILKIWQRGYGERHNPMRNGKAQPRGEIRQLKQQVEMPRADRRARELQMLWSQRNESMLKDSTDRA